MAKPKKAMLGAKVPLDWIEQFEQLSHQTGRSLTELVREALAQYIGVAENASILTIREEELVILKQKVTELESYKHQIVILTTRLGVIEQKMFQVQTSTISPAKFSPVVPLAVETKATDDEDDEDEPDEILTDFLPSGGVY